MFFEGDRAQLFRPLTGKYREIALVCLKGLYQRLHGPEADYGAPATREYIRDIFTELVHTAPVLSDSPGNPEEGALDSADELEKANQLVRVLSASGWIEKHTDNGGMTTTFRFTRHGKALIEALVYLDQRTLKTRQRNVRSARNALEQYARGGDPYDLIDAVDYAQRVISDLTDDILDLEKRKADLTRAAAEQVTLAVDELLMYMDRVFAPDIAIRMAADSVDRHRHRIEEIAETIRGWPEERHRQAERRLVALHPELATRAAQSPVLRLLDQTLSAVDAACSVKMPELRQALRGFLNRAHIIIRYASAMNNSEARGVGHLLKRLAVLRVPDQDTAFMRMSARLTPLQPSLPDPGSIRLRARVPRRTIAELVTVVKLSPEDALKVAMAQAEEAAFTVSLIEIHEHIASRLDDNGVFRTGEMGVTDSASLLSLSHAIEVAGIGMEGENPSLMIRPNGTRLRYQTPYLEGDAVELEKRDL